MKPCIEIRYWPGGLLDFGHVALYAYFIDNDGKKIPVTYASFWPGENGGICRTKDEDDLYYNVSPETVKIYTLDIIKIKNKFDNFKESGCSFNFYTGSSLTFENDDTKNCAGLCFSLLEVGGLFSKLGYQNNDRGVHYLPGKGVIGGTVGSIALIMILVGGAVGGSLTIEMGPVAIAGCVLGAFAGGLSAVLLLNKLHKELCTPKEIYNFAEQVSKIETTLLSTDIPAFKEKLEQQISRLLQTKTLGFFQDRSAWEKATKLSEAVERANNQNELITVADFILYSEHGRPSIFDIANELRDLSIISRPTETFKNLFEPKNTLTEAQIF